MDWVRLKSRDGSAAGDEAEVEVTTIRGKNKNTEIQKYENTEMSLSQRIIITWGKRNEKRKSS